MKIYKDTFEPNYLDFYFSKDWFRVISYAFLHGLLWFSIASLLVLYMFACIFYVCGNTVNQIIIGSLVILFIAFRVFLHYYHRKRNYRKTVTRLRIDPNDRFFVQYAGQTQWELLEIQKYKRIVGYVYPLANGKYRGRFLDLQQDSAMLKHLYIPLTTSITAKSLIRSENSQARVNDILIDQIFRLKCLKEGYRIVVTRTFWMAIPQKGNPPQRQRPKAV